MVLYKRLYMLLVLFFENQLSESFSIPCDFTKVFHGQSLCSASAFPKNLT